MIMDFGRNLGLYHNQLRIGIHFGLWQPFRITDRSGHLVAWMVYCILAHFILLLNHVIPIKMPYLMNVNTWVNNIDEHTLFSSQSITAQCDRNW